MVGNNYGHRAECMEYGSRRMAQGLRYKVSGGSAVAGRERSVKSKKKLMNIERRINEFCPP